MICNHLFIRSCPGSASYPRFRSNCLVGWRFWGYRIKTGQEQPERFPTPLGQLVGTQLEYGVGLHMVSIIPTAGPSEVFQWMFLIIA